MSMDRCPGCGGSVTSAGRVNTSCMEGPGGYYVNGKKVAPQNAHHVDIPSIMRAGGINEGAAAERARIVAWLRREQETSRREPAGCADAIERGEHVKEST